MGTQRYTTVLLDLDHTLLDSQASLEQAFHHTMAEAGVEEPAAYLETFTVINNALWKQVEAATVTPDRVSSLRFEQLVEVLGLDADPAKLTSSFRQGLGMYGDLFPGTIQALEAMAERATLALITNGLSDVQRARIERLDLDRFLSGTVISDEVGCTKPGTEIFELVFQQLDHPAKGAAVIVGDSLSSDIRGGTNYGIATCWFNPAGKSPRPEDQVSHTISNLADMMEVIGS